MRCAIIDDDILSRAILTRFVVENRGSLELVFTASSGVEALRKLEEHPVDLLFLDVEMPEISGLELIRALDSKPQVVLVTGSGEYAAEAFQLEVTDYLVKPFAYADFVRAAALSERRFADSTSRPSVRHLFVPVEGRLTRVDLAKVLRFEAQDDWVVMHTDDQSIRISTTMKSLGDRLPAEEFVRVHRSHIVRIDRIVDIEEGNLVVGREVIPISASRRGTLMSRLNRL